MKKLFLTILFVIVAIFHTATAQVNIPWKWVYPKPQGLTIRWIKAFDSNNWYAAGYSGTFMKTSNAGQNWIINTQAAGLYDIDQIFLFDGYFFDMNTGFVCGEAGIMSRTTNAGGTWTQIPMGTNASIQGIQFVNANTGYAAAQLGRIFKTTNGGMQWDTLTTLTNILVNLNLFALDENHIYVPTATLDGILFTSTNAGATWFRDSVGTSLSLYDVFFRDVNNGVVCGQNSMIRYTTNAGVTWIAPNLAGFPTANLQQLLYDGINLYAAGDIDYIFKSSNFGQSWELLPYKGTNQVGSYPAFSMEKFGSTIMVGGNGGLLNISTNNGTNWTSQNPLLYTGLLYDMWVDNSNQKIIAVGSAAPTPFLVSTNGGISWINNIGENFSNTLYGIKMVNQTTGYVSANGGKVFKTTNAGMNWDSVRFAGVTGILYCPDFINENTGWVVGASGVIRKTTNGGLNWTAQTSGTTGVINRIDMVDANTGWYVAASGVGRKTTDGGASWVAQTMNTTANLHWVDMLDANTGYVCGTLSTIKKTTNGGSTWENITTPYTRQLFSIDFVTANTGFAVGVGGYTLRTSNGGSSWNIINNAMGNNHAVQTKNYDSAWACAYGSGSGMGIQVFNNTLVGGIEWSSEVPENYSLMQNYPNPFNPETTIRFSIPKATKIVLNIYDINGRLIANESFNNEIINAGTVTYKFNGANLPSGVYFYSLVADSKRIDTKKMVLVK